MRALLLGATLATGLAGAAAPDANINISQLPGLQSGATIAIDPTDASTLLAGSNSSGEGTMRIYASADGGRSWESSMTHPAPVNPLESCASDPGVAVDGRGRQYYSFVRAAPCREGSPQHVYVVVRQSPAAEWSAPIQVAPLRGALADDKPAITVDASPRSKFRGRVYLAWTRIARNATFSIVISSSDDGGRTWSRPVKVNRTGRELTYASVGVSRNGTVYVAWDDVREFGIWIARSTDGGRSFRGHQKVASFVAVSIPHCGSGIVIPAQPRTCVNSNPTVSVDISGGRYSGRVYVSYARTEFRGRQAAHIAIFDARLRRLFPDPETREGRVVAPASGARGADQFWPQSAVDRTTGTVWTCFYDTLGDPGRRRAFYSCAASSDGGRTWRKPRRAATVPSDETQPSATGHYGYYQGVAASGGVAHPIWTDTRNLATLGEEIYTTRLEESDFGVRR